MVLVRSDDRYLWPFDYLTLNFPPHFLKVSTIIAANFAFLTTLTMKYTSSL